MYTSSETNRSGTSRGDTTRTGTETSTHRHHRRRRHTSKFPPEEYSDLARNDLALIASILTPCQPSLESRSQYEKKIKTLISALPTHLQSKHPLLSSFCSLHSKLSPVPITSLFTALREEIEDEVPRTWNPLADRKQLSAQKEEMLDIVQHLAILWLGPKVFTERFHRDPRQALLREKPSKCAACLLVSIGGDFPTLVAMAGLFIGRVSKGVWGSSKRIQFLLEWTASRLPASRREDGSALIWEIGRKFRMTRLGVEESRARGRKGEKRRIRAGVELEEEEEDLEGGEFGPGTASYAFSLDRELREEKSKGPRKLIGSSSSASASASVARRREDSGEIWIDSLIRRIHASEADHQSQINPSGYSRSRPRSSMYSCATSGEREDEDAQRPPSISINDEVDGVIALYQNGLGWGLENTPAPDDYEYPQLNPYARDDDEDSDSDSTATERGYGTMSRIQSSIERAFTGGRDRR